MFQKVISIEIGYQTTRICEVEYRQKKRMSISILVLIRRKIPLMMDISEIKRNSLKLLNQCYKNTI